ncbi:nicotinate phosphoribosyltransferase [Rhizobium sp. SL42]|uniref:nicotinate phosphoribosyltransferase n=1 Tax=Rhizobium sp. SL42 TaxID=2806346 RepID=UPI001F02EC02|nr:nicotinate phosphoribosyltransferase [Rhizobium sp. SL42]UJW75548.1 nicotinate phosphoribosyltransferase [Rhizobium sp. SL42]
MTLNAILNTDSYKLGHYLQYPADTHAISALITTRGNSFRPEVMFFGLQMFLKEYLSKPITAADIEEAEDVAGLHGQPFDRTGWTHILKAHGGFLPLRIAALPEGIAIRRGVPVVQVVNTDPLVPWLTSHIEPALLRAVWYPSTVATTAWRLRLAIQPYLDRTADDIADLQRNRISDYGARGTSSLEQAALGGAAHLVHFDSSDSLPGILHARRYYGARMAGKSIPAAEHSTITAWGQSREPNAFANMIDRFSKFAAYSVVSDSFDLNNAVAEIWGKQLQTKVRASGATLVVRPDSGDPIETPVQVVAQLAYAYGTRLNSKGFKVLDGNVRVIQSDGVSLQDIQMILGRLEGMGFSAENISFGMGSALLHKVNRDTLSFTMRASALKDDRGVWRDIGRRPTNPQEKAPMSGRLAVITDGTDIVNIPLAELGSRENILHPVWENGTLVRDWSFDEIRQRAAEAIDPR